MPTLNPPSQRPTAGIVTLLLGAFVIAGGIIGYAQAGSLVSLIAGTVAGVLALVAGFGLVNRRAWGFPLGLAVSVALAAFFAYRYSQTLAIMPAGLTLALSVVTLLVLLAFGRR